MKRASEGYKCAPKTFIGRIKSLTRWNDIDMHSITSAYGGDIYDQVRAKKTMEVLQTTEKKLYPGFSGKELRDVLPIADRKFWAEREKQYREEYDLNDSSDWPLLMQVLLEELTQRRLTKRKLLDEKLNIETELNNSYKRLMAALKALGITREQRRQSYDEGSENIATLSVKFDQKMRRISAIKEKDAIEEETMQKKHDKHEGYKDLPEELREIMDRSIRYED